MTADQVVTLNALVTYAMENMPGEPNEEMWAVAREVGTAALNGQPLGMSMQWAVLLLKRDAVQGRKVLERMLEFYDKNDGRADDFGRLYIVIDALGALGRTS